MKKSNSVWIVKWGNVSPVNIERVFTSEYRAKRYLKKKSDSYGYTIVRMELNKKDNE